MPTIGRKKVLKDWETVTSSRWIDSALTAGVMVAPPPAEKPFLAASATARFDAVAKSPGMYGTPARAAASAACWTWSEAFQMLPTSMTTASTPNRSVADRTNITRIWPRGGSGHLGSARSDRPGAVTGPGAVAVRGTATVHGVGSRCMTVVSTIARVV